MCLQALIDRKKVLVTEDTVHQPLQLDDAESIDCLPNEEIFAELARMGYEKPSTKLTFYKAFFSAQWKFLINKILQCMSSKRTVWNEFSSSMASAQAANDVVAENVLADDVADVVVDDVIADDVADVVVHAATEPTPPLPTHTTTPPPPSQELPHITDVDEDVTLEEVDAAKDAKVFEDADVQGRLEESQAKVYHIDLEHADKVLSMQDDEPEPTELKEVIEVVTTAKLMIEVVTAAATTINAAPITAAPSAARRRKRVVIKDPEETTNPSTIVHYELKSKDKGKGILVEEPKPLKKQAQIEQDKAYIRELERKVKKEEASRALKRKTKSSEQQAAKKQKLDEEVEELKKHLQIVPNNDDDVYTKAVL
nr:hypothetical protein [Tanacetum cinerariifolium]GEW51662.1 hypothetical protein [Tanacetum cinerariifolium]